MYISIPDKSPIPVETYYKNGIKIMNTSQDNYINLSFSHINIDLIIDGLQKIKSIIDKEAPVVASSEQTAPAENNLTLPE